MDYSTLTSGKSVAGSIRNWINRDTTDPDTVLTDAQSLIFTKLRHWRMKSEAVGTMTASATAVALPSDFLDVRNRRALRITGIQAARLRQGDEESVQSCWQYDGSGNRTVGQPAWYYFNGTNVVLDAACDQAYPYLFNYYARPAALSTASTTNFLTNEYSRFLRTACMLIAAEFEKEVGQGEYGRTYWQQQFDKQLEEIQTASNMVEASTEIPVELD